MPDEVAAKWAELQSTFVLPEWSIPKLLATLLVGGLLAIYFRFLYRWTSPQTSADSIAKVFPLLTLITIAVIFVVKTSLALSLGLVGALSIVRFRAAIKDPEELVYLFLCIGVGLALGAEQMWLALSLVLMCTVFVLIFDRFRPGARTGTAYLTVIGDSAKYFSEGDQNALKQLQKHFAGLTVERCEIDGDEGQLRVHLHRVDANRAPDDLGKLQKALPDCQISFVNAETLP